mmetsp:Transcript_17392/g.54060  ORF Transcript_17392/g.54060 Transcript_17392/m.54060 type:complete len:221 (-) Transcript_17392:472-1134(-)
MLRSRFWASMQASARLCVRAASAAARPRSSRCAASAAWPSFAAPSACSACGPCTRQDAGASPRRTLPLPARARVGRRQIAPLADHAAERWISPRACLFLVFGFEHSSRLRQRWSRPLRRAVQQAASCDRAPGRAPVRRTFAACSPSTPHARPSSMRESTVLSDTEALPAYICLSCVDANSSSAAVFLASSLSLDLAIATNYRERTRQQPTDEVGAERLAR